MKFVAIRCIFWALSASKMHSRPGFHSEPCCGSLQCSHKPPSWWEGGSLSPLQQPSRTLGLRPGISALRASGVFPSGQMPADACGCSVIIVCIFCLCCLTNADNSVKSNFNFFLFECIDCLFYHCVIYTVSQKRDPDIIDCNFK